MMKPVADDGGNPADSPDPRSRGHDADQVVSRLRALGHPLRFSIVQLLAGREGVGGEDACGGCKVVCATRLRLWSGVSAPDLTHHMKILQKAGLVDAHRDGVWVRYELRDSSLAWLASALTDLVSDPADADRPPGESP
jgi:ArsR family transcriptional regulator, arsenate/arsenite/antimonite-responsive transcriptional repressor